MGGNDPLFSPVGSEVEDTDAPPLSQLKGGADIGRAKSTPLTLSEEADEQSFSDGEVRPRAGRGKALVRKRQSIKSEPDSREVSEDGVDGKRRPWKSARLG